MDYDGIYLIWVSYVFIINFVFVSVMNYNEGVVVFGLVSEVFYEIGLVIWILVCDGVCDYCYVGSVYLIGCMFDGSVD